MGVRRRVGNRLHGGSFRIVLRVVILEPVGRPAGIDRHVGILEPVGRPAGIVRHVGILERASRRAGIVRLVGISERAGRRAGIDRHVGTLAIGRHAVISVINQDHRAVTADHRVGILAGVDRRVVIVRLVAMAAAVDRRAGILVAADRHAVTLVANQVRLVATAADHRAAKVRVAATHVRRLVRSASGLR